MSSSVFLIPEILEMILLETDTRTLLLSQKVSRLWRNLIKHSPKPQAALHQPLTDPKLLELILLQTDIRTLLLSQRVSTLWRKVIKRSHKLQVALFLRPVKYKLRKNEMGKHNPFLEERLRPWLLAYGDTFKSDEKEPYSFKLVQDVPPSIWAWRRYPINPEINRAFLYKKASWRKMLFQEPPQHRLGIVCPITTDRGLWHQASDGRRGVVSIGEVFDEQ